MKTQKCVWGGRILGKCVWKVRRCVAGVGSGGEGKGVDSKVIYKVEDEEDLAVID